MLTIVMTGATSGIGQAAAERLLRKPDVTLVIGTRHPAGRDQLPLDLERLDSVRSFADAVTARLDPIDALVLNAGVSLADGDHRTEDGFETTFSVNHLAHYLLLRLLLPRLTVGARVVITTSGTHDPDKRTPIPPPRHAEARLLAHPSDDPDRDSGARTAGLRAYTSSKLCNVLTARALATDPDAVRKHVRAVAYDPGPTPGTRLSRNLNPMLRAAWAILGTPIGRVIPGISSVEQAGAALAALATDEPVGESRYASLIRGKLTWAQPSTLGRSDTARDALWRDSAELVSMSTPTG